MFLNQKRLDIRTTASIHNMYVHKSSVMLLCAHHTHNKDHLKKNEGIINDGIKLGIMGNNFEKFRKVEFE